MLIRQNSVLREETRLVVKVIPNLFEQVATHSLQCATLFDQLVWVTIQSDALL